jgi:hypothetical protein
LLLIGWQARISPEPKIVNERLNRSNAVTSCRTTIGRGARTRCRITHGLKLTAPLVQAPSQPVSQEEPDLSRRLADIAGYCIVGVAIVAVGGWLLRKKKS